jgi:hypothetical protein
LRAPGAHQNTIVTLCTIARICRQGYNNATMDPLTRLTLLLWQLSRRRLSRREIMVYALAVVAALAIGLIEWAGYWPESWKVERGGLPRVTPL